MFDGAVDGAIDLDLEGEKRRADDIEEEAHLVVTAGDDGGGPLVGSLGLHPGGHVLPPEGGVGAEGGEHLLRDGDVEQRLEGVLAVEVGAHPPHGVLRLGLGRRCMGMHSRSYLLEETIDGFNFLKWKAKREIESGEL